MLDGPSLLWNGPFAIVNIDNNVPLCLCFWFAKKGSEESEGSEGSERSEGPTIYSGGLSRGSGGPAN